VNNFEEVLNQYEPMISASIRTLNIYRDQESFRQTGRAALWQAWTRFDIEKGNFTPFAYRSIRGAMLDKLKRENIMYRFLKILKHCPLSFPITLYKG
jgi:DNA-directed RNA polymerase specialized sigma subunit